LFFFLFPVFLASLCWLIQSGPLLIGPTSPFSFFFFCLFVLLYYFVKVEKWGPEGSAAAFSTAIYHLWASSGPLRLFLFHTIQWGFQFLVFWVAIYFLLIFLAATFTLCTSYWRTLVRLIPFWWSCVVFVFRFIEKIFSFFFRFSHGRDLFLEFVMRQAYRLLLLCVELPASCHSLFDSFLRWREMCPYAVFFFFWANPFFSDCFRYALETKDPFGCSP